ncbi:hypothetical protein SPRG_00933 [Saprolegnia parasitica CBS 223.65]|uniref:Timeless N-terminal domain-containing protein n=1 Tax=Saprolegnia parasitica (strain CBS 223.65) TaxID=695850 RepID=A0A067CWJ2_SAPPC|nr:hypothetical protein SPRG_00933 [Saprolegnia parasitica CBS 223.65]KDO34873.1 hypothetical protein SPRG_00933 [Saprolegnia parasitica CBS 223.65]|eukprot:XP_012194535.1 hypothetical protein SPRG_00933 [Saprolegnia parasitica CBS 223.65]
MASLGRKDDALLELEDDEDDGAFDEAHCERARSLEALDVSENEEEALVDEDGNEAVVKRTLDPAMLNELLLVCSNLGVLTETDDGDSNFTRGEDCEEWIHDLQRAIRRDHAIHRLVSKTLGRWQILQKKLIPLLINHQNDWSLVFSILKVLVMLTMKPANESDNIALQLKYLRGYKRAFLTHGVVQLLMSILVEPLSREGSARTSQDYLNMELVLTLFRNLLAIPNESLRHVTAATNHMARLQEDLIVVLYEENVFDMLLLFAQDIESAENREWNLLLMEMFDLVLQTTTPKQLVATIQLPPSTPPVDEAPQPVAPPPMQHQVSLLGQLKTESQHRGAKNQRHSNFGGMLVLQGKTGCRTILTDFSKSGDDVIPQAQKKGLRGRRQKQHAMNDIQEVFGGHTGSSLDLNMRLSEALRTICDELLSKCYPQLTSSLKNEFRRGSGKLLPNDRLLYFHLVWFLTAYHRLKLPHLKSLQKQQAEIFEKDKERVFREQGMDAMMALLNPTNLLATYDQKAILSTLDMFSFNFVLQSIESYAEAKNYHAMIGAVKVVTEMIAMLTELVTSADTRLQRIGQSLQHKLFYEREFLDRLPVLIKSWSPSAFTLEYVVEVATLTHLVLKMIDTEGKHLKVLQKRRNAPGKKKKKQTKKKTKSGDANDRAAGDNDAEDDDEDDDEEDEEDGDRQMQLEMRRKEEEFDTRKYFGSMISHESIKMYCYLLRHYKTNSAKVNHYVFSFFYRVQGFQALMGEDPTMEPMLFNIQCLMTFNTMLQDPSIQNKKEFRHILDFLRTTVRHFFALAETNHLLYVESLIRHPFAPRTCVMIQRRYKSLLPESLVAPKGRRDLSSDDDDDDDVRVVRPRELEIEGEAEFDFMAAAPSILVAKDPATTTTKAKPARKPRAKTKTWSVIEDKYLTKMYFKFKHLPSVFEVISYEDMFQDRDRTPDQIERRVKHLKLHKKTHDDDDDDDDDGGDDDDDAMSATDDNVAPRSPKPTRSVRKTAEAFYKDLNGSEDDDDDDAFLSAPTNVAPSLGARL